MRKSLRVLGLVLLIASMLLAGCGTAQKGTAESDQKSDAKKLYSIGASASGGGYYILAGGLMGVLKDAGINSSVQTTGGGRQNAILVDTGEVDLGLTNNVEVADEYENNNHKNIRSLATAFPGTHHFIVRADSPIKTMQDLNNYQYGLTQKGSTHDFAGVQILDILGIKPKRIVYASKDDTNSMVRDKLLPGYFMTSGVPIPTISDLESDTEIRFLTFTDEEYNKIKNAAPWLDEDVIKAGTYKAATQDIKTFGSWNVLIANKDLPDDVVYKMMDAIFANTKTLTDAYPSAEVKKELVSKLVIPLHPGAVKWYQDNGVKIPDNLIPPEAK